MPSPARRLILAAATVALTAGLSTGVASADTTGVTGSYSPTDTKRAISDIFSCKYQPNLPWCRHR
ncbi:hypothetical protein [Corynebacterium sp.]|uniref:hypothetical protein n=1 Tax=Corynebacterium sp. TaxID=1720 RepID=UPI003B3A3BB4